MEEASVSDVKETDRGSRQKSCEHIVTFPILKLEMGAPVCKMMRRENVRRELRT